MNRVARASSLLCFNVINAIDTRSSNSSTRGHLLLGKTEGGSQLRYLIIATPSLGLTWGRAFLNRTRSARGVERMRLEATPHFSGRLFQMLFVRSFGMEGRSSVSGQHCMNSGCILWGTVHLPNLELVWAWPLIAPCVGISSPAPRRTSRTGGAWIELRDWAPCLGLDAKG